MEAIKLLRLNTGEDIICYTEHYGADELVVREPMMVVVSFNSKSGKQTVALDHWLPVPVIKENEAIIKEKDIIASLEPTTEFIEYFENAVESINKYKSKKESILSSSDDDDLTQEDISNLMDWMDSKPRQLH